MTKPVLLTVTCLLAACGGPPVDVSHTLNKSGEFKEVPVTVSEPRAQEDFGRSETMVYVEWDEGDVLHVEDETDWVLLLNDPDPDIRQDAIDELLEIGGSEYVTFIELALSDPHPGVREAAAEALEELGVNP